MSVVHTSMQLRQQCLFHQRRCSSPLAADIDSATGPLRTSGQELTPMARRTSFPSPPARRHPQVRRSSLTSSTLKTMGRHCMAKTAVHFVEVGARRASALLPMRAETSPTRQEYRFLSGQGGADE